MKSLPEVLGLFGDYFYEDAVGEGGGAEEVDHAVAGEASEHGVGFGWGFGCGAGVWTGDDGLLERLGLGGGGIVRGYPHVRR
jgi:hypothetical protein